MSSQAEQIRSFILNNISKHPADIVAITATHFSVTRTTIHRHLNILLKKNLIFKSGTTRNLRYYTALSLDRKFKYTINKKLSEFDAFKDDFEDLFQRYHKNIFDICAYGFTEIFNNALDHSKGTTITVSTFFKNNTLCICIEDNGVGVFNSIYEYFDLEDMRESVLQLSKGKMTTDPLHHSGEGIFFASKSFDKFEIYANQLHYIVNNNENDWAVESTKTKKAGSTVCMEININSKTNLVKIFKQFQNKETLAFDKTEIIVELAKIGDDVLMSRSQAKRIVVGLEKFRRVVLNFKGVRLVGQGFVDEVFRVYKNAHPKIKFEYINANSDVQFMIRRSLV